MFRRSAFKHSVLPLFVSFDLLSTKAGRVGEKSLQLHPKIAICMQYICMEDVLM